MVRVFLAGEDAVACNLAVKIVRSSGLEVEFDRPLNVGGCGNFLKKISALNEIARNVVPVLAIADGDQDPCLLRQLEAWKPENMSARLIMRLAYRECESWLLADAEGLASFLQVNIGAIPREPDLLSDPKRSMLGVIKRSGSRVLREEMLPAKGKSSPVGLGYNLHLEDFVRNCWEYERAAARSPSLARIMPRLHGVLGNLEG